MIVKITHFVNNRICSFVITNRKYNNLLLFFVILYSKKYSLNIL